MKNMNINTKITTSKVFAILAIFAVAIVCVLTPTQTAFAGEYDDYGYGSGGYDSGYDFSTYTPSYSASSYTPSYSSSGYTPSYSSYSYPSYSSYSTPKYSYSTPSYSYSTPSYSSYTPSSSGSSGYSYTPSAPQYSYVTTPSTSSASNYSPSAQSTYVQANPTATSNSTASNVSKQQVYVSASNTNNNSNTNSNSNTNTNTSNITNNPTFVNNNNPTNVNDVKVIVLATPTSSGTTNNTTLDGNCYISPSNAYINQDVTFSASATGGNGSYTYSWSGSDGISAYAQSFTGRFSTYGSKTATVTITSNGQSITRSCSAYVQGSTNNTNLSAYCVANPTNAGINQTVTWTVYPSGGNSGYSYAWSGDGLYGNGQSVNTSYSTTGYKYGTVTVYSNGQSVVASCNTTIGGNYYAPSNVVVTRDTNLGTPVSGVFLSQVPATGISFGLKMTLFTIGLLAWSLFIAFVINEKRKAKLATVGGVQGSSLESRIEAFKKANMAKKGIIA